MNKKRPVRKRFFFFLYFIQMWRFERWPWETASKMIAASKSFEVGNEKYKITLKNLVVKKILKPNLNLTGKT